MTIVGLEEIDLLKTVEVVVVGAAVMVVVFFDVDEGEAALLVVETWGGACDKAL